VAGEVRYRVDMDSTVGDSTNEPKPKGPDPVEESGVRTLSETVVDTESTAPRLKFANGRLGMAACGGGARGGVDAPAVDVDAAPADAEADAVLFELELRSLTGEGEFPSKVDVADDGLADSCDDVTVRPQSPQLAIRVVMGAKAPSAASETESRGERGGDGRAMGSEEMLFVHDEIAFPKRLRDEMRLCSRLARV